MAGLAASISLAADGHRVELIDERFDVPDVGTALGIFSSAQRALDRLGVLDVVQEVSAAPRVGAIHGSDGRVIATVPAGDALLVARSDLVRILQENVPRSVRITRRRITDVRPLRDGADLFVGADGIHSLMRRSGWRGRSEARRHDVTVLRGTADIAPPEVSETWGGGWLVGMTPLAGRSTGLDEPVHARPTEGADPESGAEAGARAEAGMHTEYRTNWFACIPEHRTRSIREDLDHLCTVVGGHREAIDTVLAAARPEKTLVHGILTAPYVHPVKDNVVLIGDAAHAMAPNLGHGANTALEDALALSTSIAGASVSSSGAASSLRSALRSYGRHRSLPDQGWRLASQAVLSVAMMDRRAGLRDRALRTVGALR